MKELIKELRKVAERCDLDDYYDINDAAEDIREIANNLEKAVTNCNQQKDWRKICAACQDGEPPKDCEFYGEPDGCNARPRCIHPTCKESFQVGNAAKIRKALEQIDRIVWDKHRHTKEESEAHRLATEALAMPPRNCDLYSTEEEAWDAFSSARIGADSSTEEYEKWLFAEAKGETR